MTDYPIIEIIDQRLHPDDCKCRKCKKYHPAENKDWSPDIWAACTCAAIAASAITINYILFA